VNEEAPCDFTAMGHLLVYLEYATYAGYHSGVYRTRCAEAPVPSMHLEGCGGAPNV
jgi:hypothetical protein